jgi:catechol 2,3-dioxygenase-like lactoylglutathione lyase family enzyme
MSIVKATDIAYVRFRAPDLVQMASFLRDFGMFQVELAADRLFMRGYGESPFIHATERGDPGFAGYGIRLNSIADLAAIAAAEGTRIEPLDAPGGGQLVRLRDPDGYLVEVVAGQEPVAQLAVPDYGPWNHADRYPRQSATRRLPPGPSHVKRLGHIVIGVADFPRSEAWYKSRFGLLTSDQIEFEPGVPMGAFMRCDRGDRPCDHHTIAPMQLPGPPAFNHAAFEVHHLDDLMLGHAHLKNVAAKHFWGIGRHIFGSQVFDYWTDPWGNTVEHWTDGDQFTAADPGGVCPISDLLAVQWGMPIPPMTS